MKEKESYLKAIVAHNAKLGEIVKIEKWTINDIVELCKDLKLEPITENTPVRKVRVPRTTGGGKGQSRYGHRLGTESAIIDDMVYDGVSLEQAQEKLSSGRTPEQAKGRFLGHINHLRKDCGVMVKRSFGGVYQVETPVTSVSSK